jgi:hypothetical protein
MKKTATISDCGKYRYNLTREWDDSLPRLLFVMLNPSTADAEADDPTIRRCISRAKDNGFGSVEVVNLFAYRATNPDELKRTEDPVGSENDKHIIEAVNRAHTIIVAWGTKGGLNLRDHYVSKLLSQFGLKCLGMTKDGFPKHPLYIASNKALEDYR